MKDKTALKIPKPVTAYNGMIFKPESVTYTVVVSMRDHLAMRAYEKDLGQTLVSKLRSRSAVTISEQGVFSNMQGFVRINLPAGEDSDEMMDHIAYLIKTHATKCLELAVKDGAEFA